MKRIIFFRSGDHYNAMLTDGPGMWASGSSMYEAVGNLIVTWAEKFDIEIQEAERGR
jgi:hypothetical protein